MTNIRSRFLIRHPQLGLLIVGLAVGIGATFIVQSVRATGIPTVGTLTYTGSLANLDGTPVTATSKNIGINMFEAATGGTPIVDCLVASAAVPVNLGQFQVALPDGCAAKVQATSNLWIEVAVDGASLGRTKLGAVPYAVESGHAVAADSASGALAASMTTLDSRLKAVEGLVHAKSGFHAWLSDGSHSITSSSGGTALAFDQVDFDLNHEYDPISGTFSPKGNGVYLVNCGFFAASSALGVDYTALIYLNGTGSGHEISANDTASPNTGAGVCSETTVVATLAAGDKVTCAAWTSGGTQTLPNGFAHRNRFSAVLLY